MTQPLPPPEVGSARPPQPSGHELTHIWHDEARTEREQIIRIHAATLAADIVRLPTTVDTLIETAEPIAAYIRDGRRPEVEPDVPCNCTQEPGSPSVWDGTQCPRHNPLVRDTWSRP